MKKRAMALILVIFLVAVVFMGCGGKSEVAVTEDNTVISGVSSAPRKLVHITQLGHPYSTALVELATKEAEMYGYTLDVFDMKGDIPTQIANIEDAIAKKYDAIIVQPYDAVALNPVIKKANAAGIPVIIAAMKLEEGGMDYAESYVGSSGILEGIAGGEMVVEALNGIGNFVEITGATGHPLVPQRGGEAQKVIRESSSIKLLASETGNWDSNTSMTVMENFISRFGDQIDLVYCHDSGMAMGAISAIEDAGLTDKIKVVSINGTQEEYDAIKAGRMYGTILNDVSFIAINEIRIARDILEGRGVFEEYVSPAVKITKRNVDIFTAWF